MRKKLLLSAMCVAMLCSLTACGKDGKKDDSGKTEVENEVTQTQDDTTKEDEEARYITMLPDEVVAKLEEAGFVHSRTSTDMDDENNRTHIYKYDTDDAFTSVWIDFYEATGELQSFKLCIQTNSEEDLEKFNELITMFFIDEADKQEFIDLVYKKDVKEGINERIDTAGLICYRQNMNVDNSTSGGDYKYYYNVSIYLTE